MPDFISATVYKCETSYRSGCCYLCAYDLVGYFIFRVLFIFVPFYAINMWNILGSGMDDNVE